MSESRTGEWPVAIFDVRLSLQLEAKDFTSVDEEPLNLVASTWRLSMRSIWPLPVTKTQGSSTQRPQGVKSFWLMVLVGRPVLTTPPVVYSIMFCVPGCWTDLSRRNARLAANPLALYAFREYEWGIWYLAWRTHRHSFAHHFTSASWDGRKPINLPQMPRIYSNVRKRKKNQRRQKGMKESCTSGLLGCQDISSFTGICCCCCLASLYLPCDGDSECRRRRWTCLPGVDWLDGSAQSREKRLFFTHHWLYTNPSNYTSVNVAKVAGRD